MPRNRVYAGSMADNISSKNQFQNMINTLADRIRIGLALAVLTTLTGCVGWVDGGGGYVAEVVAPEPDVYLFGGSYERGRDVRDYSRRGAESHALAHPGNGGHAGGGGGHDRGGGGKR